MVSRAAIRNMLDDVDDLEARLLHRGRKIVPFIHYPSCMDRDAVIARHFVLYPDERDADVVVITALEAKSISEINGYHKNKADQAWRVIAAEARNGL